MVNVLTRVEVGRLKPTGSGLDRVGTARETQKKSIASQVQASQPEMTKDHCTQDRLANAVSKGSWPARFSRWGTRLRLRKGKCIRRESK